MSKKDIEEKLKLTKSYLKRVLARTGKDSVSLKKILKIQASITKLEKRLEEQ